MRESLAVVLNLLKAIKFESSDIFLLSASFIIIFLALLDLSFFNRFIVVCLLLLQIHRT